jgi:DNA-binding MarR family transcriptional regulator
MGKFFILLYDIKYIMGDIFFHKKGKSILLSINKRENQNITEIAREIEGTYAHTFNLLKEMERLGIVKSTKKGRTKYVKMTPKGKKLAKIVIEFENTLEKKGKKALSTSTTPTHEKLEKYKSSLEEITGKMKNKKPGKKERGSYSRVIGRYRSLVQKQRPRDKAGKKLKSDALELIEKIDSSLKK